MMSDDEVSVIITTYYRNNLLEDAIESAVDQTHEPIDVIVVDDSGEAHAQSVVDNYPAVTYVPLAKSSGPHAARNVGVTHAKGTYIQFLDDDDVLHPEKFALQLPVFSESVGVVYSGYRSRGTRDVELPDPTGCGAVLGDALRFSRDSLETCYTCTMLIDRTILDRIVPFSNCHAADDLGMKIELASRTEFDFVNEPLVERRMDSQDHLGKSMENIEGRLKILERYSKAYDQYPAELRRTVLGDTYRLGGFRLLKERVWSPFATLFFLQAAYYSPDNRMKHVGLALASFFGAPGIWMAKHTRNTLKQLEGRFV